MHAPGNSSLKNDNNKMTENVFQGHVKYIAWSMIYINHTTNLSLKKRFS